MNNKAADQTARMHRMVCAFVFCKPRRQFFSPQGPYYPYVDVLRFVLAFFLVSRDDCGGSSSRCNGFVCGLRLWYFLTILIYYFCDMSLLDISYVAIIPLRKIKLFYSVLLLFVLVWNPLSAIGWSVISECVIFWSDLHLIHFLANNFFVSKLQQHWIF